MAIDENHLTILADSFTVVNMENPMKGWQPITQAAKRAKVSRQWLHKVAKAGAFPMVELDGYVWVPDPLTYKPNRARQKRARDSYK